MADPFFGSILKKWSEDGITHIATPKKMGMLTFMYYISFRDSKDSICLSFPGLL